MSAPAVELVDTHCHLVLLEERGLLEQALESAEQAGVTQMVSIGLDVDDSDRNRQMAERYAQVWFTVGWHPHTPTSPGSERIPRPSYALVDAPRVAVGHQRDQWHAVRRVRRQHHPLTECFEQQRRRQHGFRRSLADDLAGAH